MQSEKKEATKGVKAKAHVKTEEVWISWVALYVTNYFNGNGMSGAAIFCLNSTIERTHGATMDGMSQ